MRYYDKKTHAEAHIESATTILDNDVRVVDFFKPLEDGYELNIRNDLPYVERIVEPTIEEHEELNKKVRIDTFDADRNEELKGFVIDGVYMNEDLIKTMFIAYSMALDADTIEWIGFDNSQLSFTKNDFGLLLSQGSEKIKEIYFRYRSLKDGVLNGSN